MIKLPKVYGKMHLTHLLSLNLLQEACAFVNIQN